MIKISHFVLPIPTLFVHLLTISAQTMTTDNLQSTSQEIDRPAMEFFISAYRDHLELPNDSRNFRNTKMVEADTMILRTKSNISLTRIAIVSGTSLAIMGESYYRFKNAWWNNGTTKFHLFNDYQYAKNVDKVGHFYGAMLFAEGFWYGFKWSGFDDESSLLYGGLMSSIVYTGIEIKDGFTPEGGFSLGDIGASILGSSYPYLQKKISLLQDFNFKWSYWPSKSPYFQMQKRVSRNVPFFADDYEGETFWLSVNVKTFLPGQFKSFWPDFLNMAVGVSVEKLDGNGGGNPVFLLSPDLDLTKLFKPDSEFLNTLFHYLNVLHIPLPAIRISPNFRGYALYLKP